MIAHTATPPISAKGCSNKCQCATLQAGSLGMHTSTNHPTAQPALAWATMQKALGPTHPACCAGPAGDTTCCRTASVALGAGAGYRSVGPAPKGTKQGVKQKQNTVHGSWHGIQLHARVHADANAQKNAHRHTRTHAHAHTHTKTATTSNNEL
jgi:hypothetical protein